MVVGEYLQLGVEVQEQVDEASESRGRMARWERLQTVVDLVLVASAYAAIVHNSSPASASLLSKGRNIGVADGEEMRAQTSDEALEHDLEDSGGDQRVQKAQDGIVDVPE